MSVNLLLGSGLVSFLAKPVDVWIPLILLLYYSGGLASQQTDELKSEVLDCDSFRLGDCSLEL